MKLNLGCGFDIKPGYVNMDRVQNPGVDVIHNLEIAPYPFEADACDEIHANMVLEHISGLANVMDELVRISRNDARINIIVPYFSSPNLWWDMTHVRGFNTNTFSGFHSNSLKSIGNIRVEKYRIHFLSNDGIFMESCSINKVPDFFINLFPKIYERFFCYLLPSAEIHYTLRITK